MASSDSEDYDFEVADAGAEGCNPISVGSIKRGGHVLIRGFPCKVMEYSTAKTGKHGAAKAMYMGIDIFTGRKYEDSKPTDATAQEPIVTRTDYDLVDVDEDDVNAEGAVCSLLDGEAGKMMKDVRIPMDDADYKPMRDAMAAVLASETEKTVVVTVLAALGTRKLLPAFRMK